jgi:hypothetical protein
MRGITVGVVGLGFFAALSLGACAQGKPMTDAAKLTSGTVDHCRGASFDADHADERCLHHGVGQLTPPPSALQVSLAAPAQVRSGYDAGLTLEMRNVSAEPLELDVDDACGTFEATASNENSNSFETDCFDLCGRGPEPHVLRVTLEPNGVVKKHVKFYAVETRIIQDEHQECVEKTTGGLPPGNYALRITLPWTDAVAEHPEVARPRVFEASLQVTP